MTPSNHIPIHLTPCPNDTFVFCHFLEQGILEKHHLYPIFEDIEALNKKMLTLTPRVTKASFSAYLKVKDFYTLLPCGAALGQNCGPLLISKTKQLPPFPKLATPGLHTTAFTLLKAAWPKRSTFIPMTFDKIIPSITNGDVDGGLIIHESRFTYQKHELHLILDLGKWWSEKTNGLPLPLGGIFLAKSHLNLYDELSEKLTQSILWAQKHPKEVMKFCLKYAQEMSEDVLKKHIDLYVNQYTIHQDEQCKKAIKALENIILRINPDE